MQGDGKHSISNPSDVTAHGMKLPMQRIMHPVRHAVLAQARRQQRAARDEELLCGNPLFALRTPEDVPAEITNWPPAEYLP
jgi:hypothetical protein